jgi:hypothetical protein
MSRLATIGLYLAAFSLAAACASAGSGAAARIAGCYYFERDAAADQLQLPWGVRLLDRPLEGWPLARQYEGVRVATTLTGQDEADHPFGFWRPLNGDSIQIGYPAGGGLSLRLDIQPGRLAGTAHPVGDALPLGATPDRTPRPVALMHARCPEET